MRKVLRISREDTNPSKYGFNGSKSEFTAILEALFRELYDASVDTFHHFPREQLEYCTVFRHRYKYEIPDEVLLKLLTHRRKTEGLKTGAKAC